MQALTGNQRANLEAIAVGDFSFIDRRYGRTTAVIHCYEDCYPEAYEEIVNGLAERTLAYDEFIG